MSFFVKNKGQKGKRGVKRKSRKTETVTKSKNRASKDEDELTSDSEQEDKNDHREQPEESEDELETAQEKKLKLARVYLEEIERAERAKLQDQEEIGADLDLVGKRLKEDYLRQTGRLKTRLSSKFSAFGTPIALKTRDLSKRVVTCTCLNVEGTLLFTGTKCGAIYKFNLETFQKMLVVHFQKNPAKKGEKRGINSVSLSTSGKHLALGRESGEVEILSPKDLSKTHTFNGHRGPVTGVVFRKGTDTLYTCSSDRSVKVWSLSEMAYVETLYGHQAAVRSLDALTRERALTGSQDGSIRVWKIAEESQLVFPSSSCNSSVDVVRLLTEETFISGGDDGCINLWNVSRKKPLFSLEAAHGTDPVNGTPFWICALATLAQSDVFASGSGDGLVRLWRLGEAFKSFQALSTLPMPGFVNALSFAADGRFLTVAAGREHRLGRWNVLREAKNVLTVVPLLMKE